MQPQSLVTVEARYPRGQLTVELTQLQAHSYSSQHWVFRSIGVRCGGQEGGDSLLHSSFLQAEGQHEVTPWSYRTERYTQSGFVSIWLLHEDQGNLRPRVLNQNCTGRAWKLQDTQSYQAAVSLPKNTSMNQEKCEAGILMGEKRRPLGACFVTFPCTFGRGMDPPAIDSQQNL